jgi:hypothetical protein
MTVKGKTVVLPGKCNCGLVPSATEGICDPFPGDKYQVKFNEMDRELRSADRPLCNAIERTSPGCMGLMGWDQEKIELYDMLKAYADDSTDYAYNDK